MFLDAIAPSVFDGNEDVSVIAIIIIVLVILSIIGALVYLRKGKKVKKIKSLVIIFIMLFIVNVKADMGPPMIAKHEVMVTNKEGAVCYNSGKSEKIVIPYGTTFTIDTEVSDGYIYVNYNDTSCGVKSSDVSSKTQKFSLDDESVTKITPVRAIILAKGGLNMRKGPSVTFSKIITIPQYSVVKLTHSAGDYWYYCEYNGQAGWITGMNGYFGYDGKEVLTNYEPVKVYSSYDRKSVIGKIPADAEITDYIKLVTRSEYDTSYYVIYNGMKGYIGKMMYKTDGVGKIKLIKDYEVRNELGDLVKKLTPQELSYNMISEYNAFYLNDKKIEAYIPSDYYEFMNETKAITKTKGFLGEGLFGEKKEEYEKLEEDTEEVKEPTKEEEKSPSQSSTKDIIIICLLGGIFLALTALVVIKIVNNKKKKEIVNNFIQSDNNKEV